MAKNNKFVKKFVWYVHRPTREGRVEHPALWRIERVEAGSALDRLLDRLYRHRLVNEAGETVEPGERTKHTETFGNTVEKHVSRYCE
jgi:hypothetical protein